MSNNPESCSGEGTAGKYENNADIANDEDENCITDDDDLISDIVEDKGNSVIQKDDQTVTKQDTSTFKKEHVSIDMTSKVVKRQKFEEKEENANYSDSVPDLTNKLLHDELLILFSWLPLDDLLTVSWVCHSWRVAAQDKYVWKNRVLTVEYNLKNDVDCSHKNERKVKLMPNIRNIEGDAHITLLNVILENVTKLNRLNVKFNSPISSSQLARVVEKYPEIQSITLCVCMPDILNCLELLKTSTQLKEVVFYSDCFVQQCSLYEFMSIFTDCNNFPALTALNFIECIHFVNFDENYAYFRNILCDIIAKRSQQLSSLRLQVDQSECFNAISQCVNLQRLELKANSAGVNVNIDIKGMTQLRLLEVQTYEQDRNFMNSLQSNLNKGSWLHLTEVDIDVYSSGISILKAIIDNVKGRRRLHYSDYEYRLCDDQFENIGSLLKLKDLRVDGMENITHVGICYISKCYNLKSIILEIYELNITHEPYCIRNMLRNLNKLQTISVRAIEGSNIHFYLTNRQDIERYIM